jgi:hypothetical protein
VASTLCPACGTRVEHPSNYTIAVVQKDVVQKDVVPDAVQKDVVQKDAVQRTQTKLVANDTLVIHTCTTAHDPDADPPDLRAQGIDT